jgi:hypothetical protein
MALEFTCPSCGGILRVEDDAVGQVVRCGGCMTMLRVPDVPPSPPEFPGPPAAPFPEPRSLPPPIPGSVPLTPEEPVPTDGRLREPPRPRRRRDPREEHSPTGRSPLFWVFITFCFLSFGSCIFCCGIATFMTKPNWRTHASKEGGYAVEFPAAPRIDPSIRPLKQDQSWKIEGTRIIGKGEDYAVLYKDIEPSKKRRNNDNAIIDQVVRELEGTLEIKKIGLDVPFEILGFPGREVKLRVGDGGTYVVRIIVADNRLYILVVGSRMNQPQEENVQRFLNSFTITDEKLIAEAEARRNREETRRSEEERAGIIAIGRDLANNAFQFIVKEQDRLQLAAIGATLAEAPVRTIIAELHQQRQKREVAALSKAIMDSSLRTLALEQSRIAEQNRVMKIAGMIGKAITSAIEATLAKSDEP